MTRKFEQRVHQDKDNTKVVAIGQTRNDVDEWITPVAVWEKSKRTGIYYPPGVLNDNDVDKFRVTVSPLKLHAKSFEQIEVNGITRLTSSVYEGTQSAKIESRSGQASYRIDGGAPTFSIGHFLNEGDVLHLDSIEDIARFTAVNTFSKAILAITYFSEVI